MERNAARNALVNLLVLLAAGVAGFVASRYARSYSGLVSGVFMALGVLVSAVSWFQMRLLERERLEKLEFDELTKSAASSALFNANETEVFPARRSREQFERFFIPIFAVILFIVETGGGIWLSMVLQKVTAEAVLQPLVCLGVFGMLFLVLFMLGRFSTNLGRSDEYRLLRPSATWVLLNAYLCLFVLAGIGVTWFGVPKVDWYVGRVEAVLLVLVGVETLVNLTLELYRPRVKGKVERPIYESRLVSLLGQPEGLITTAAHTLDYQFGFKVSETWFYRLFARWLPWLVLAQAAILVLSTSIVFVDPGEQAILERVGRFVEVLQPGAHFKFPWPIDRAFRYAADKIQTVEVGFVPDGADPSTRVAVFWSVRHAKNDENFIVAKQDASTLTNEDAGARPLPVDLLTVGIPVQFQITNLQQWVYNNRDPDKLLEGIAYHEVSRYFVNADIDQVLSSSLGAAAEALRNRIQAQADQHELGVKIVFLGLEDIHPPVEVAPDYENVVSSLNTSKAMILQARSDAINTNMIAEVVALKTVANAQADRLRQETNAFTQAELFTNQLPAYLAAPSVYKKRMYLETFSQALANTRTYFLLSTNIKPILILNQEPKINSSLTDISIPAPTVRTN